MRTPEDILSDIRACQRWRIIGDVAAAAVVALAIVIAVAVITR